MARSLWTGSLGFGLVSIPIKLVAATRSHDVRFNMLCAEEGVRVRRKLVCGEDEAEIAHRDTVKGYEVAPDEYAVVTQEELDALAPEKTREMSVEQFIALDEIDPIYFERSYYLMPTEAGAKGYRLLQRVMQETGKVAIARFVMRNKEYLVAIRPQDEVLGIATLRYHDEVVPVSEIGDELPAMPQDVDQRQLTMAEQLVATLTEPWDPARYEDEYRRRVMELVEAKIAGEEVVTTAAREERSDGKVIDLMAALEQSLAAVDDERPSGGTGKAAAKGTSKSKAKATAKTKPRKGAAKKPTSTSSGGGKGGRKRA